MSFDSLYNSNPNLKLKILRDLVNEFRAFVAGAAVENDLALFGGNPAKKALNDLKSSGGEAFQLVLDQISLDTQINEIQNSIIEKFMFSSNGAYQMIDLLKNVSVFNDMPLDMVNLNRISAENTIDDSISILAEPNMEINTYIRTLIQKKDQQSFRSGVKKLSEDERVSIASMRDMLKHIEIEKPVVLDKQLYMKQDPAIKKRILGDYNEALLLEKINRRKENELFSDKEIDNSIIDEEKFMDSVLPIPCPYYIERIKDVKSNFINSESALIDPTPNRPLLTAAIIRRPEFSHASRNDNFLSVFFGAVTPLELSRCVPFISVTFFNEAKHKKGLGFREYLDNVAYMKFSRGDDGIFSAKIDDVIGLSSARPIFSKTELSRNTSGPVGYMDIFTAPQTMVNANINKPSQNPFSNGLGTGINNEALDNVLDPFAPMLSLDSFSVSVSSGGMHLVTNRRAKLTLRLHDRSRLEDIAPFISLNQLSKTIVKVEHGWSHPDGDVIKSNNPIGKFLNCMREALYYQLQISDFSFNNNEVTINLTLEMHGGTEFDTTSAASGANQGLGTGSLNRKILTALDHIIKRENLLTDGIAETTAAAIKASADKDTSGIQEKSDKKIASIHKNLQIIRNSFNSTDYLIDTEKAQELELEIDETLPALKNQVVSLDVTSLLTKILETLGIIDEGNDDLSFEELSDLLKDESIGEELKESRRKNIAAELIKKVKALTGKSYTKIITEEAIKKDTNPVPNEAKIKAETNVNTDTTVEIETKEIITYEEEDDLDTLTPDYFTSYKTMAAGINFDTIHDFPAGHTSLGKLICGLIALPLAAANSNYSEVQVYFHPINNNAAGARKYTTASLPIKNTTFLNHIQKAVKNNFDLTTRGVFDIISNILEDNSLEIYELEKYRSLDINKLIEEYKSDPNFKKLAHGEYELNSGGAPTTEEEKSVAELSYLNKYRNNISKLKKDSLSDDLKAIYANDEVPQLSSLNTFRKPIIHMEIETVPVIVPPDNQFVTGDNPLTLYAKELVTSFDMNNIDINKLTGIDNSKRIMRIHIYDSNATSKPFEQTMMESSLDPSKFVPTAGKFKKALDGGKLGTLTEAQKDRVKTSQAGLTKYIEGMSFNEIKQYMIRAFPTIKYGSHNAVVKSINVNSNTDDEIVNARLNNELKRQEEGASAVIEKRITPSEFSTFVIPTSVDITLYGCPFITVGLSLFLDLGTGTDIDNIYTVGDVTHSISSGDYTTNVSLYLPSQGSVSSTRDNLLELIKIVKPQKGVKTTV